MDNFLPQDYEIPATPSNYTKFEDGETVKFRILPSGMDNDCIVFYEYFDKSQWENGKPIRSKKPFDSTPWIENGRKQQEKWAFKVWNYNLWQVQICNISQKGLKQSIMWYIKDEDYWDPLSYDIKISRTWKGLETEYSITPTPPKEFDESLLKDNDKKIDWVAYLNSEEPFITE